jgi:choline dehydrogenase
MNAMIYMRGNPLDFDEWAAAGADGWSFADLLPYFRKAEGNEWGESDLHGGHGPLAVSSLRSRMGLTDRFIEAAMAAGFPANADFNGASQLGFGRVQVTQRAGVRCSTAQAYLHPASERLNLDIYTDALTTGVIMQSTRAAGINIVHHGETKTLTASRETILCAGSYGSPQLLMLSGIGRADTLKPLGIACVTDLPVGENLQEHPFVWLNYLTDEPTLFSVRTQVTMELYRSEQRGPFSSNGAEAAGFVMTRSDCPAPDVQIFMVPNMVMDESLTPANDSAFSLGPCVLKPSSRGTVSLRSARPDAKPRILNRLLTTPDDRRTMIAGVRTCLDIANQTPLKDVRRAPHLVPASDSDADIWPYLQERAGMIYHPTSTCSIGSVVDPELRVFGIEGLRVVDASVMPSITRGNTNAAVIAIAEKAADLIAGKALLRPMAPTRQMVS